MPAEIQNASRPPKDSVHGVLVFQQRRAPKSPTVTKRLDTTARILRLNTVCPYYTMFPLEFPFTRLSRAGPDDWVLDPFCGRGTTTFAARLRGVRCVGIDSNPIAAAVAAAKLSDTTIDQVTALARKILKANRDHVSMPDGEFWELCFHRDTLREICIVRECLLRHCSDDHEIALRALMLGILHGPKQKGLQTYLSNQMPRTYATKPGAAVRFWKRKRMTKPDKVDVLGALERRARHTLSALPPATLGAIYFGDARRADTFLRKSRRFRWVITSPPYFGMRTYRSDQWLRNWFLGGKPEVDYTQDGQLAHHDDVFADELAAVWRAVATQCLPKAKLIVRFGYLPSIPLDPRELLGTSLKRADVGWRIRRWQDAGSSDNGRRQATQFGRISKAVSEFDAYVTLEC